MAADSLADILRKHRERIAWRFGERSPASRSALAQRIEDALDEIGAAVVESDSRDSGVALRSTALERLVREYGALRDCILRAADEAGAPLSADEVARLARAIDERVAAAARKYDEARDDQRDAEGADLLCLAQAARILSSSSLNLRATLTQLTALMVPRLADCCTIHLEGADPEEIHVAHVEPTKVGLVREIFRRFPSADTASMGYATLQRTGEPHLVTEVTHEMVRAAAQSPEHLAMLEELGVCSWLLVPLRVQEHMLGALALAYSVSSRRYTQKDVVLAVELAHRAAAAIDSARLYALSQTERSRAEAANRAKDEFVAIVSHELRTPLTAILGWTRLIRSGTLGPEETARALGVIERNADAQNRLVADLLDISRTMTGKIRIQPAPMDLAGVIDAAVEGVRPAAAAKQIAVDVALDRTGAAITGDADRLQQVVWNLLTNAVKFTQRNGVVRVRLRAVDSDLEIVVEDDGDGIVPEFLPHVFDIFRQSDATISRRHGGLGLGLSIAKHIVELHGGSIHAASPGPGRGATFSIRLPMHPELAGAARVPRAPATKPGPVSAKIPDGGGLRVLVVDDERDARELIAFVLRSRGMDVRVACSASEALEELQRRTPDVVVSDIGMAERDGYALIRSIRTLPSEEKRTVPAIALTAYARNADRMRALTEGFNRHIAKPVEPTTLVQAVLDVAAPSSRRRRA